MGYLRLNCHLCPKENSRDFGQEARFVDHLTDVHGIVDQQREYDRVFCNGIRKTCECHASCAEDVKWGGWKKGYISRYARGHNARVDSIYLNSARQKEFAAKRSEGYRTGRNKIWSQGLSKESNETLALSAKKKSATIREGYASGRIVAWTIVDPDRARAVSEKISISQKKRYADGAEPWNKGLTRQLDNRLKQVSESIKKSYDLGLSIQTKRFTPEQLIERISRQNTFDLLTDPSLYKNKYQELEFRCRACGRTSFKTLMMLSATPTCFYCHPKESKPQLEIFDIVRDMCPDAVLSDRSAIAPLELDILVPSKNIAIEFNGLYWHSEIFKSPDYHEKKMLACRQAGIKLLSIYEDEWRDKSQLISSMIKHRLGDQMHKFDARKLKLVAVEKNRRKEFFESNHLEGDTRAICAFGLETSDGELVACVSLRRPFHKKWNDYYELGRSACKLGCNVRGWLGRLSKEIGKFAMLENKKLMTYVDSRVGPGDAYSFAGWKKIKQSTGNRFWWTDFENRFNRFKYKSDKSRGMTQQQVADEAGVVPIYGCSNSIFVYGQ